MATIKQFTFQDGATRTPLPASQAGRTLLGCGMVGGDVALWFEVVDPQLPLLDTGVATKENDDTVPPAMTYCGTVEILGVTKHVYVNL